MKYTYINIALETFSLIICLVLLIYQFIERRNEKKISKWFTLIILGNMGMLIGDICDYLIGGMPGYLYYVLNNIFTLVLYFCSTGLMLFALYGWLIACINQKTSISSKWINTGKLIYLIHFIIAITLPLTKICYIDRATNQYVRGRFFYINQICPYLLFALAILLFLCNVKAFAKREVVYIGLFVTIPMIAEIIQIITVNIMIVNVSATLGLIFILMFMHYQREIENEQHIKEVILTENKKLESMQNFQENFSSELIEVLCKTVEAKDIYTRGHSMRVAGYAREIMYRLGGSEKEQQEVYYIGILHDVGKISVKDEIINKKGKLTDEEYEQIKLHTVAGYQILRKIDVIPNLAVGARWHHERFDGTGYPNGLAGENIPLVARIISVADAYDAMTSNRTYHSTMPQHQVRKEIERGMGTQFDPRIAQIMLNMIDEDLQYDMKQTNYNRVNQVLLIDDDKMTHKFVQRALIDENCMLTSAYSGKEGIETLKESKYDLCLLDMEMSDLNGFEVLSWIHENVRNMKVIFLTGDKELETIKKSEALGARDYITKPVNITVLKESIKSVLIH